MQLENSVARKQFERIGVSSQLQTAIDVTLGLVQSQGTYLTSKQKFVALLGYDLPTTVSDDLNLMPGCQSRSP